MSSTTSSVYRLELDGLRAFAVSAVVINHANSAWLPGGYLGVDSFFVLSGYVVAFLGKRSEKIISEFYRRRLRRPQPALALMILSCVVIAAPLGLLSWSSFATAAGASLGLSNIILFNNKQDYFGSAQA